MVRLMSGGMICLLLAMPAMAQSVSEKTGVNSMAGIAPSTQDFVTEAAQSDMFEIQSSEAALKTNGNTVLKTFAQRMVTDHTKTTAELKAAVTADAPKISLPTAMTSSQQSMLKKLQGLHGADFDRQYVSDQVSGHKDAVSLFQRYSNGGENPKLKAWAAATLPTLQQHLDMAQKLNK